MLQEIIYKRSSDTIPTYTIKWNGYLLVPWDVSAGVNWVNNMTEPLQGEIWKLMPAGPLQPLFSFGSFSSQGIERWLHNTLLGQRKIDPIIRGWWLQRSVSGNTAVSQISDGVKYSCCSWKQYACYGTRVLMKAVRSHRAQNKWLEKNLHFHHFVSESHVTKNCALSDPL